MGALKFLQSTNPDLYKHALWELQSVTELPDNFINIGRIAYQ